MTNKEAIILAGGLGTRLKGVIKEIPKPMAPIDDKPFLYYLLRYLEKYNFTRAILSVGYKHEVIKKHFGDKFGDIELVYAVEEEPLGTGGGILNALNHAENKEVFLLNGDTFFDVNLSELYAFHQQNSSDLTLSIKPMKEFDRYGTVELSGNRITQFNEKKYKVEGLINGGVYVLNKSIFNLVKTTKFSFETDLMEKYPDQLNINGFKSEGYFIDIGIPEDYYKAKKELPQLF